MTISSQTSRISYVGNGSTTDFAVPFYFAANADLVVYLTSSTGVQTLQVLGTHYTLTGATLSSGGTCTFITAPTATTGAVVAIYRDPAVTQTTSYNNNDPFPAESHELALDKLTTIAQRTRDIASRAIHQAEGEGTLTTELLPVAQRKNTLLGFGTTGELLYALGPTYVSGTYVGVAVVDTRAVAQVTTFPASIHVVRTAGYATVSDGGGDDYIRGTIAGPGAFQDAGGNYWERLNGTTTGAVGVLDPAQFGAVGDGTTNDAVALQAWATALADGGIGIAPSLSGYATGTTITFTPSTNTAPVRGPRIVGNFKLKAHASLTVNSDLLRIWNPTATTTSQNFYSPRFERIEVSGTTGTGAGVSVRGFWGEIGSIFGQTCAGDLLQFPNYLFGGIPDEYESSPTIGDVTGIDIGGYVVNNKIGIGATPRFNNLRGTVSSLAAPLGSGCLYAGGSEQINGGIAYTGYGTGVTIGISATALATTPHEIFLQGNGDIDVAQYGFKIETVEYATITGHRVNIEPINTSGIVPSWPLTAYSFGKATLDGRVVFTTVNAYIVLRAGLAKVDMGTLFEFNNDPNINNLILNVSIQDGAGILSTLAFADKYKNIQANATLKIIENGLVIFDNINVYTFAQLPTPSVGLRGVHVTCRDSTTAVFGANIAGTGANVVPAWCDGTNWRVG